MNADYGTFQTQDGFQQGGLMGGPFQNRTIPANLEVRMFVDDDGRECIGLRLKDDKNGDKNFFYTGNEVGKDSGNVSFPNTVHDWSDFLPHLYDK